MTRIIEKRVCLHKTLAKQQERNNDLELQVSQMQALANVGITTCMVAHEINNLLTPLSNYSALALNNPDDKLLVEKALQKTVKNCERASKIMESMLAVANGRGRDKKNIRLAALVDEIFACLCRDFSKDRITVNILIPEDLTIWAVGIQIQQVLMNLILNARDAMLSRGGILTIRARDSADTVQIEIADTGSGIEAADLNKVFEPFFTTKTAGTSPSQKCGGGLGLAFCKKVIEAHKGSISVESEQDGGTTFKIVLPKLP